MPSISGCGKAPVINSFFAENSTVFIGAAADLHWSITGADSILVKTNLGDVVATSGDSCSPHILKRTTFTLIATNGAGTDNKSVTVDVYPGRRGL